MLLFGFNQRSGYFRLKTTTTTRAAAQTTTNETAHVYLNIKNFFPHSLGKGIIKLLPGVSPKATNINNNTLDWLHPSMCMDR